MLSAEELKSSYSPIILRGMYENLLNQQGRLQERLMKLHDMDRGLAFHFAQRAFPAKKRGMLRRLEQAMYEHNL